MNWMDAADIENKQGIISVHESADIMHRLNLKAVEAPYKIVIIWLPEKMNHPAANKARARAGLDPVHAAAGPTITRGATRRRDGLRPAAR